MRIALAPLDDALPLAVGDGDARGAVAGAVPFIRQTQGDARAAVVPSPAELYGDLFDAVQRERVYEDSKTFVDAVPYLEVAQIRRAFETVPRDRASVDRFVAANFALPAPAIVHRERGEHDLRAYVRSIWRELCRDGEAAAAAGSLLPVTGRYPVPGGRFSELYYWDSYFSILGLVRDGYEQVARETIDTFAALLETYGRIPNGTRSYYLSRSQPPLYFAMLDLAPEANPAANERRLDALLVEHAFWMESADALAPGECTQRVVRMADGALLNRYWDDRDTPRDESYSEDRLTAARSTRPHEHVFRALRAAAESGWDFSSRWFADGGGLESIRSDRIVPIDLNACLYGMERAIAALADASCQDALARRYADAAKRRRLAVQRWLWHESGHFCDHDLDTGQRRGQLTAATLMPLFTGLASQAQAACVAQATSERLLAPGGLRTTLIETGEQWDWPNGWAPLQWIAFAGLRRYGHRRLARAIAQRWTATVDAEFQRSGWIHEKYDVERGCGGGGGEYTPKLGFGWTNGVTAAFMDLLNIRSVGARSEAPRARARRHRA